MLFDPFQRDFLLLIQGIIKEIFLISWESIEIQIFFRFCGNIGLFLALADIDYDLMAAVHLCAGRSIQLLIILRW